jgi:hypothetical protein
LIFVYTVHKRSGKFKKPAPVKKPSVHKIEHVGKESFFYLTGLNENDMDFQLITGRPDTADHLAFTTTFTHNNVFYKAALAETISWEGKLTGTYDALLQSGKGTQRLTLIKEGEHWRAGEEVEQIGIIQQDVVDLLGSVISKVRR